MHLISIITATYNSSSELLETYKSISSQTLDNWEWLVTDDCSSDSTYQLLQEISEKDQRVKVFKNAVNCRLLKIILSPGVGEF